MLSRKNGLFIVFIMAVLLCSASLFAATYYVATSGDDANAGTQAAPWKSINNGDATSVLQPGDTVIVQAGTYEPAQVSGAGFIVKNCSGSAGNPITYKANGEVTISNTAASDGNLLTFVVRNEGVSYITYDGFNVSGAAAGIYAGSGSRHIEIKNCYFSDLIANTQVNPRVCAVYVEGGACVDCHDNEFAYLSAYGDMASAVMDMHTLPLDAATDACESKYYNNLFHDFYDESNYATGVGGTVFWLRGQASGCQIFNNTFVNVKYGISAENGLNATIKNNIFYSCTETAVVVDAGTTINNSNNLFYANKTNYGGSALPLAGVGDMNADPLFVDPYSDFTLTAGSPAINAGCDMGLSYNGSAADIGAFESDYTQTTSGTIVGTVTDQTTGNGIAGAKVQVNASTYVYTSPDGTYTFPIASGSYSVSATAAGYTSITGVKSATVAQGGSVTANFVLKKEPKTYYVSPDGSDDNEGTIDSPWATISNGDVKGMLVPGDTVIIKAGTYEITEDYRGFTFANCAGTADAPITYAAEDGAIVDGQYFVYSSYPNLAEVPRLIGIKTSYITVKNLEVKNFNVAFLVNGSNNIGIVIDGCDIHESKTWTGIDPASAGVYIDPTHNSVTVKNCNFYNFAGGYAVMDMTSYWDSEGHTNPSEFYNNCFYNMSSSGFWFRGNYVQDHIYNNTFYNVSGTAINAQTGNLVGSSPIVKNNIFVNCGVAMNADGVSTVINSNNLVYGGTVTTGVNAGENTLSSDPMFVDAAAGDFTIADTSPAVNNGVDVGLAYNGTAPDMGAYETSVVQSLTGKIIGRVTVKDTGVPMEGIKISLVGNATYSATSDSEGYYTMIAPVGSATVTAESTAKFTVTTADQAVTVPSGEAVTANFEGTFNGATYYVAPGGDDANDGSEANPWATIWNGDSKGLLKPGDTVVLKAGTYEYSDTINFSHRLINCDGTKYFPITYKAEPGAVLVNTYDNTANHEDTYGLYISAAYTVIDGLEITGSTQLIVFDHKASHSVIKNCKLHDTAYTTAIWPQSTAIYINTANLSIEAYDNEIYNIGIGATGECFGIFNMTSLWTTKDPSQSSFHNNVIYNVNGGGFCLRGGNNNDLVYNNTINNVSTAGVVTCQGIPVPGSGTVKNNIIANSGIGLKAEAGCTITNSDNLIFNCGTLTSNVELGVNTITMDPLFTDVAAGDFTIADNSPAVNNGVDVGFYFIGIAPDMGAYETSVLEAVKGNIKGAVTTADINAPVAGIRVYLVSDPSVSATTLTDGTYTMTLDPGVYDIAIEVSGRYSCDNPTAAVTVTGGETATQNFVVNYETKTFYVSTTGDDANDGLTKETAWFNINRGDRNGAVQPGDTVLVQPGTYTGDTGELTGYYEARYGYRIIQQGGNKYYPVTYKADGAVLVKNEISDAASTFNKCLCVSAQWIIIDGFECTSAFNGIAFDHMGANTVVQNCDIHDLAYTTVIWPQSAAIYIDPLATSGKVVVRNNKIHDYTNGGGWSSGVFNMGAWGHTTPGFMQMIAYGNQIYNVPGPAFNSRSGKTNDLIYNNTIDRCYQGVAANDGAIGGSATAVNNIITNSSVCCFGAETISSITMSNNMGNGNSSVNGTDFTEADPMFTDAANGDYSLKSGSPAIGIATDLSATIFALTGWNDLGAIQYDGPVVTPVDVDNLGDLKNIEDGSYVKLTSSYTVSAVFDNMFYIENADRTQGIGVYYDDVKANAPVAAGDEVTLQALVATDPNGERVLSDVTILTKAAGTAVKALGVSGAAIGGFATFQPALGTGVNNIGLLVRSWGKVSSVGTGYFVISDGSADVKVFSDATVAVGDFVKVTGISSCDNGAKAIKAVAIN